MAIFYVLQRHEVCKRMILSVVVTLKEFIFVVRRTLMSTRKWPSRIRVWAQSILGVKMESR